MTEEYLDIFNDNMTHIGVESRSTVHEKGLWHQSFHCWIVRREAEETFLVFQKRGPEKKLFPNALDISAAGHLVAGEGPAEGLRELSEEIGISANFDQLVPLGIRCDVVQIGKVINREFCHTFLLEDSRPLDEYKLQVDEVSGLVQMRIADGLRLFDGAVDKVEVSGFQLDNQERLQDVKMFIGVGDVIPRLDRYYLKVILNAERFFLKQGYYAV